MQSFKPFQTLRSIFPFGIFTIFSFVMKILVIIFMLVICHETFAARTVSFDAFEYSPKESDLLDYGSLTLKQGKKKSSYVLNGNFTVKRTLGNEKIVVFEVWTRNNLLLVKTQYAFCEFTRIEKQIWPDLIKFSNMPQNNPCPFPAVSDA